MITKIEIDGFKTFKDFSIELAPFQVIIGANAAGKSNLFDALRLLKNLAEHDLRSAFLSSNLRGDVSELFTISPTDKSGKLIKFAVELLLENQIKDSWGVEEELNNTRLRYELEIEKTLDDNDLPRLFVNHEALNIIKRSKDKWYNKFVGKHNACYRAEQKRGRTSPFISTKTEDDRIEISLHQEGKAGKKRTVAEKMERTILSGVNNTEFPTVFAVRETMRNWKFLQFSPEKLSEPSKMDAPQQIAPDGSNIPAALARIESEDSFILNDITRDLSNIIQGIKEVNVYRDEEQRRLIIYAETTDNRRFSSRVLSEGTLRVLALSTLKNDPNSTGTLCFEEPENGVHPFRLKNMVELLREMSTDFSNTEEKQPLKQMIINSHSPVFISELLKKVKEDGSKISELLFAHVVTRGKQNFTRITPVTTTHGIPFPVSEEEKIYAYNQVIDYLERSDVGEALAEIKKGGRS